MSGTIACPLYGLALLFGVFHNVFSGSGLLFPAACLSTGFRLETEEATSRRNSFLCFGLWVARNPIREAGPASRVALNAQQEATVVPLLQWMG